MIVPREMRVPCESRSDGFQVGLVNFNGDGALD
jgi:hypothetical protein